MVIPIVIGAIGTIPKGLKRDVKELEIWGRVRTIQTTKNIEKNSKDLNNSYHYYYVNNNNNNDNDDNMHPRDYVNRLYVSRNEGGRGLVRIPDALIQRLEDLIKNAEEDKLQKPETIQIKKINRIKITRKQILEENNSIYVSIGKQAKSHRRKLGHG